MVYYSHSGSVELRPIYFSPYVSFFYFYNYNDLTIIAITEHFTVLNTVFQNSNDDNDFRIQILMSNLPKLSIRFGITNNLFASAWPKYSLSLTY